MRWLLGLVLLGMGCARDVRPVTKTDDSAWRFPSEMLDPSTSPCDDFYQHACGGWIAKATIPPGATSVSSALDRANATSERAIDELLDGRGDADTETARLRAFFGECVAAKDGRGLLPLLARISAVTTRAELEQQLRDLHAVGARAFFDFSAQPDRTNVGLYRGEIHEAWIDLPPAGAARNAHRARVARVLEVSGLDRDRAAREADAVVAIEAALAPPLMGFSDRFDAEKSEHPLSSAELTRLAPHLDWAAYLAFVRYPDQPINVTSPTYLRVMDDVLARSEIAALRAYLRWSLVEALGRSVPGPLADALSLRDGREAPARDRRQECRLETTRWLGVELSRQFSFRFIGPATRARATSAADAIRRSIAADVATEAWLSPESRAATARKLERTNLEVGYPDVWPPAGSFPLGGSFFDDLLAARAFERRRSWARASTVHRRDDWEQIVYPNGAAGMAAARLTFANGFPDAFSNSLVVTAAYLQRPLFDPGAPREVHYGGFGAYMGHELVHVAEAHELDEVGRQRELWTAPDVTAHAARQRCIVEQADADGLRGQETVDENAADFGGLALAYRALRRELGPKLSERGLDGLSREQRFFYAYAHGWCTKERPEASHDDSHGSPLFRVNGPVSNISEFASAFGCRPGTKMIRPAPCRVW